MHNLQGEVISFIRSTDTVRGGQKKGQALRHVKPIQMSHTTSECLF